MREKNNKNERRVGTQNINSENQKESFWNQLDFCATFTPWFSLPFFSSSIFIINVIINK